MKKSTRDIIFLIFFIAFFVSAPMLIFYSMGYRYNFKKNKIESVGALYINASPKNSTIFINQKETDTSIPAKMVNLSPQDYTITIKKDGYYSWTKTLSVHDKKTTFAQNIFLYKQSQPELQVESSINIFKPSPNKNKILFSKITDTWEELWVLEVPSNKQKLVYRIPHIKNQELQEKDLTWSSQGRFILAQTKQNQFIIDTQQSNTPFLLQDFHPERLSLLHWDNRNDSVLYGLIENSLYKISLDLLTSEKIYTFAENVISDSIIDYHIKNGNLYYVQLHNKTFKLYQHTINNTDEEPLYLADFDKKVTHFKYLSENYFSVHHPHQSYIFNVSTEIPNFFIINSADFTFNSKTNQIAYFTDFEIWTQTIHAPDKISDPQFITRYSDVITQVLWDEYSQYLVFNNHTNSFAIEQDTRDQQNTYEILKNITIEKAAFDATSHNLYFIGENDNQKGIFSTLLHEENDLRKLLPSFNL